MRHVTASTRRAPTSRRLRGSRWEFVDLRGEGHIGVLGVVVDDVVLHFVVGHEAEVAVRALTWFVVHAPIVDGPCLADQGPWSGSRGGTFASNARPSTEV